MAVTRNAKGAGSTSIVWPAERFYWAVIDSPGLCSQRVAAIRQLASIPEGLVEEIQGCVPVPMVQLHAVAIVWPDEADGWDEPEHADQWDQADHADHADDAHESDEPVESHGFVALRGRSPTRLLVCAAPISALSALLSGLPSGTTRLSPASIPKCLRTRSGGPGRTDSDQQARADANAEALIGLLAERLNLLVGRFEPAALTRRRRIRHGLAASWLIALTGMMVLGLWRRAEHHRATERGARTETAAMLSASAAPSPESLRSLLRRAERANEVAESITPTADVTLELATMLHAWPAEEVSEWNRFNLPDFVGPPDPMVPPIVEVQQLLVQPDRATVTAIIAGGRKSARGELADHVLSVFRAPSGWQLDEPRWSHHQHSARLSFALRPSTLRGPMDVNARPSVPAGQTDADRGTDR